MIKKIKLLKCVFAKKNSLRWERRRRRRRREGKEEQNYRGRN